MCIIGCAPKMKLSDDVSLILKGEKEFEDLKKDLDYLFEETIFPVMFNPKEITDFGKKYHHKTRSKVLKLQYSKLTEWVKVFVKEAKILKNNYLFQGTMATAEGTAKSPNTTGRFLNILSHIVYHEETSQVLKNNVGSLRPFAFNQLKKGPDNYVIKVILVFGHNRNIKSYLYQFPKSSFMLNPKLTKKYLKQNKNLKPIDKREGFKIIYLETEEDMPDLKKAKKTVFLSQEKGLLKKVVEKDRRILGVGLLV